MLAAEGRRLLVFDGGGDYVCSLRPVVSWRSGSWVLGIGGLESCNVICWRMEG